MAEGAVDVYPRMGPNCIWDTPAGHAVVAAAGGVVCQPNNSPLTYAEPAKTLNPFFVAWGLTFAFDESSKMGALARISSINWRIAWDFKKRT